MIKNHSRQLVLLITYFTRSNETPVSGYYILRSCSVAFFCLVGSARLKGFHRPSFSFIVSQWDVRANTAIRLP